jgi:hypothetical protein
VANQKTRTGFDNVELNLLYEFFENDKHEAIASIGLTWDIGRSGSQSIVGNDTFSTWTPTFYFGKGSVICPIVSLSLNHSRSPEHSD